MLKLNCLKCGHKWESKKETIEEVNICPKCKSKYWNNPNKGKGKKKNKNTYKSEAKRLEIQREKAIETGKPVTTATQKKKVKKPVKKKEKGDKFKLDIAKKYRGSGDDELEKLTNKMLKK